MIALTPASSATRGPSGNGKNASDASAAPDRSCPCSPAFSTAILTASTRLIWPAPIPIDCRPLTITIASDLQSIGIGAGQMSRVDAVKIAVEKAGEHGHDLSGAALASDAFFPFPDGPRVALEAGVKAIIQ